MNMLFKFAIYVVYYKKSLIKCLCYVFICIHVFIINRIMYSIHDVNTLHKVFYAPKELWEAYSNRTVRQSVRVSVRPASCPVHISYIL